ncbi:S-adenosyl-L-methionine-dependent methyltransferase [Naviculisporaceae sp. PSN 640]
MSPSAIDTNETLGHDGPSSQAIDPSIIVNPNDLSSVPTLLKQIQAKGNLLSFNVSPETDLEFESARLSLLHSLRRLTLALEKPRETMIRQNWGDSAGHAVLTIGIEAGIWSSLASCSFPQTVSQIHAGLPPHSSNFHRGFLTRILKHAAAMGYITEVGPDTYVASNFVKSLTIPIMGAGYQVFSGPGPTGGLSAPLFALPAWLKEHGYDKEPGDACIPRGPFQYANVTDLNMFQWFHANEPAGEWFNFHMGGYAHGRPRWFDEEIYPVKRRLMDGFKSDALLVDIGGGLGHDIEAFAKRFPHAKGRLVLQDLEHVIEQGKVQTLVKGSRVERTVYDFHTEQPVKGARAYYLHSILHDWSDEICVSIIANIKAAMKPGYSRLLIDEGVIPDTNASWEATGLDIVLSALLSSRERTRAEWTRLLEGKAGLKINKFYHYLGDASRGTTSLIECELVV